MTVVLPYPGLVGTDLGQAFLVVLLHLPFLGFSTVSSFLKLSAASLFIQIPVSYKMMLREM
jgi:hypothetical protein